MSLPPGFLDELRARVTLSAVVGRSVSWDPRKSNRAKGDWWAPCPFHQEKTASFHVDDRKGFYYCFGCHAKGDALTFLKESANMSFMEAVEALAREAGMQMPARDPQAAQRADRRTQLAAVMDEAVKIYRLQLRAGPGATARDYLARRRLSEDAQDRWDLGFAPDSRQFLFRELTGRGIAPDLIEAAGLVARAEDGSPYDRFRGRIIFPIRDGRGRAISLGGRSLDPEARAKYLNGPETELFDKGRTLFNLDRAREATGKGATLILAEGYMDVIALSEAGFGGAVAPLGTAVTEDQLRLMWRIAAEPVVALDGDKAGLRAALRVIDLALPLLEAGQGLRFALLPQGQDPDDLIRAEGPAAMQKVLDAALPMARLLWQRETEGHSFDSPERKAALRKRLREAIGRLRDPDLKVYYAEAFRHFEATELRPEWVPAGRPGKGRGKGVAVAVRPETKATLLARGETQRSVETYREDAVLALLLTHPHCLAPFEGDLETLEMVGDGHGELLHAILRLAPTEEPDELAGRLRQIVGPAAVDRLLAGPHIRVLPAMRPGAEDALVIATLEEQLAKLAADRARRREIGEAEDDMGGLVDEFLTQRLAMAAAAVHEASRSRAPAAAEGNEDAAELSKSLQDMIDNAIWIKKRR